MSLVPEHLSGKIIPAQLNFLAIYNPSLGTTDDTVADQIVYYYSAKSAERSRRRHSSRSLIEESNAQLRQIGLAQGMVEFGKSFSDGRSVDTIETERSRIILHELESGWWILASINLTVLPSKAKDVTTKGKGPEQYGPPEYSSREVKPAILLLGDLLRAHSTFLLHHASSMSALFVRTRRSKFIGILGRYWDTYLATWNVLLHGNPANSLYGGIKIAACGELGVGVGEEERGSGEREVLEGFVGRIDGLVDIIVSRFGDAAEGDVAQTETKKKDAGQQPTNPWLGSGNDPAAEDGAIFLGTGALSRKSLRDVSHWMEDLYRWGLYAYGVVDNPTSNRRAKTRAPKREESAKENEMATVPPMPIVDVVKSHDKSKRKPQLHRGASSHNDTDSDSSKGAFVRYLKLGYGTHWSFGGTTSKVGSQPESPGSQTETRTGRSPTPAIDSTLNKRARKASPGGQPTISNASPPKSDSSGHYLIGLMGAIEDEHDDKEESTEDYPVDSPEGENSRLVLRTLTLESEREEDARAKGEISIDLGSTGNENVSSKHTSSEHTATSSTSFETQDRNKAKKLRVVVYVYKPFIFVLLFELRADALAFPGLYRSFHHQLGPLIKPLLNSTTFRPSKPNMTVTATNNKAEPPIYDLVWDPRRVTINSTIPNIPDPLHVQSSSPVSPPWSRMEALNTHMQILNTYTSTTKERIEMERTCKTSRGWWVVWTRIPEPPQEHARFSGPVKDPGIITEDSTASSIYRDTGAGRSRGQSTFAASSLVSGPAHPYLDIASSLEDHLPKDKEIFLIRRASDHPSQSGSRFVSGSSTAGESGWGSGPARLAQGIGVDTKSYIEGLLNLNR
ncbi:Vacuolar fusion protein-like protein [Lachnellula occidentalis]|uniref:Vacuolar fusion protein-like protein n=1 Tax=Lachnellula occidentalis TaxID=215460 RepID=A0A8H8RZ83_9HELO|nr:Vacuolar fusion protein-like protein [Lachnellula occidentalis]